MKTWNVGLLTTVLFVAPVSIQAAVIGSVDRGSFLSAVQGGSINGQNFDGLASGAVLGTLDGVTYSASNGSPVVTNSYLTSTSPNGLGRTGVGYFLPGDTATFSFVSAVTAFAIDINTFANADGTYVATLNIGDVVTSLFEVFSGAATGQFIGFVSDTPFTTVTIGTSSNFAYTLDTVAFGAAAGVVAPVPEPGTLPLLWLGLAGMTVALRRRTTSSVQLARGQIA